jgi:F420-dependent oxidoreductase-like protein
MELRIFTEPQQGATYEQLCRVACAAEEAGFGAFFRSDHYLKMGAVSGEPGPTDAWITLAGLARDTSSIRLGTLVTSATFRLPGPLAVAVAEVDAMSGGRVELGLGAGWYEEEHQAFGIPFPEVGERFERLEEQLAILSGLWSTTRGASYSFAGRHYRLEENPALARPAQPGGVPIIVGGHGTRRTPALAARFAAEFNIAFASPPASEAAFQRVAQACEGAGRDPASIVDSAAVVVCCGTTTAEVARRAAAIGRDPAELRENGAAGSPAEVAARLGEWADAGASRIYLQVLDLEDLDHVRLLGQEVLPALA